MKILIIHHLQRRFPDAELDFEAYTFLHPEKELLSDFIKEIKGYDMYKTKHEDHKHSGIYLSDLHHKPFDYKGSFHFYAKTKFDLVDKTHWENCLNSMFIGFKVGDYYSLWGRDNRFICSFPIGLVKIDIQPILM
ncbi:MAG: hypothetical protein KC589_02410 [Nanoarchaeota archaeon]|nr:hypothetical protein [Nanoarchaeota archaeon]